MSASKPVVAVLATMDTKSKEAHFVAEVLAEAGVDPWLVDLSMKAHQGAAVDVLGAKVAEAAGTSWQALGERSRQDAAAVMVEGGTRIVLDKFAKGELAGAVGIGGANGTNLVCSILRALPYLVPKVMISTVAGTAAAQWYVAESDIAMYPSIGDVSLNRITKSVMENAALAVAAAAQRWSARRQSKAKNAPLVGVSSFGGTAACVDRVTQRLEALGYEVILFHASGVGGKTLERLARAGELAGVIDVTTHELADLVVDGVYSAGDARLTGAGASGLPQVVVPGAIDHSNFWANQVPERYRNREFFRYNAQNLLMRTDAAEFEQLGRTIAERLNAAKGPVRVLLPLEGFSEHTKRRACDLDGNDKGPWRRPEEYRLFVDTLKSHLKAAPVEELPLHVNDSRFADACVDAFLDLLRPAAPVVTSLKKSESLEIPIVRHETDVLIVGGGAAATMAAFECADAGVRVIQATKGRATSGTTTVARGGFAAAMGKNDSPELHLQDILKYGGELIDPELARVWVYDIVQVVRDLESWGAEFVRGPDGELDLKMFPSHSRARACHHYDTTGNMITKVLSKKLRADARIEKHSITAIVDLIKRDGRVVGAWGVDYQQGTLVVYHAQQTILCTGGGSGLFYVNDNPPQVTGDGYVQGFRAGVALLGIEMIDFQAMCCSPREMFGFAPHPTGFINASAVFRNQDGEEFLKRYFPDTAEESTRSEVILAMAKEIHAGRATPTGGIFMDATKVPMEVIQKQIPHVYKTCLHRGIDITKVPLEVAPGSHTWLGGLEIDIDGKTPVAGLFAAGETAGGIHGGNRIGGSALSASLVYGRRAGKAAAMLAKQAPVDLSAEADDISETDRAWLANLMTRDSGPLQSDVRTACRMLAHNKLGPIREARTLKEALAQYERIEREDIPAMRLDEKARTSDKVRGEELESALSVRNLALLGRLLATAALNRTESRGAHFRLDYPNTDDARWRAVTRLEMGAGGEIKFRTDPVKESAHAPARSSAAE